MTRALGTLEGDEYLEVHMGMSLREAQRRLSPAEAVWYLVDPAASRQHALAALVASAVPTTGERLIYLFDEDVFESECNMHLMEVYRRSLGAQGSLAIEPYLLVDHKDQATLICILSMVMWFAWSVVLAEPSSGVLLLIDHHNMLAVHAPEKGRLRAIEIALDAFGLKRR